MMRQIQELESSLLKHFVNSKQASQTLDLLIQTQQPIYREVYGSVSSFDVHNTKKLLQVIQKLCLRPLKTQQSLD